jgi:GDP-D-mannose dehydratase
VRREARVEAKLEVESSRVRATDIPYLVADPSKAHRELGWEPEMPLGKTVRDMLEASPMQAQQW